MISMPVLIIIILLIVLFGGGGFWYTRNNPGYAQPFYGVLGVIIAILIIVWLLQQTGLLKSGSYFLPYLLAYVT
jgi:hypothetical protein